LFDHYAADGNRFQYSQRRQNARATNIYLDIEQSGFDFLTRVLIGKGTPGIFSNKSQRV
jgi:hypothetical protein